MLYLRFARIPALLAASTLAACSGGLPAAPSGSGVVQSKQLSGNCINPLLEFVSDNATGQIYVYNGSSSSACLVISNIPQAGGMDVDPAGTLYVASAAAHRVFVFKAPYAAVSQVIHDGARLPGDVALCPSYIAATNLTTNTVTIFSYGGAILRVLNAPAGTHELYATCDPKGNLYTDGTAGGVTSVVKFANGMGAPIALNSIAAAVANPGGLEWENGKLWIDDRTGLSISVWAAPFSSPSKVIHLGGAVDPVKFEIDPTDSTILSADQGLDRAVFYNLGGAPTGVLNPFTIGGSLVGANYNQDDTP